MKECGAPSDDWASAGCVDGLLHEWWGGFSFLSSCPVLRNGYGI